MANITTTTSGYPAVLDTRTTLTDGSSGDEIVAAHPNGVASAAIAIETELGTDVAGSATDLKTRLAVAHNDAGAVTLGTAASLVGVVPFNRGGLGLAFASTTNTADGYLVGFANGVLVPITLTSSSDVRAVATSGTWTFSLVSSAKLSGDIVQMRFATVTGFTTTAGNIPADNTPPQSTEGQDFGLSVDILPTATTNKIFIEAGVTGSNDSGSTNCMALFIGASTSAVAGTPWATSAAANAASAYFTWNATSVSLATTTYTLRLGGTAGTFTLNGQSGAGLFGNNITSTLKVWEVQN